jgi:pimeloyl-ACP methyl ester carboxylesterase
LRHRPDDPSSIGRARWKDLPTWYVIAAQDRMIPAENQHFMADRMSASMRAYPMDHTPLVTAPAVVTDLILEAVAQARSHGYMHSQSH